MKFLFPMIAVAFLFVSCEETASNAETAMTSAEASAEKNGHAADNYILEDIPGSDIQLAILKDPAGNTMERGAMLNGRKTGTWTYNHIATEFPAKVISYVNGMYNGVYLEINDRGQIELMAYYKNNKLHGPWAKMRFGKAEVSATYKDGELDGVYKELNFRDGRLKKEVSFKNGKEDGIMRYYNDEGEVTVEYIYRDGEKISGGIVEE